MSTTNSRVSEKRRQIQEQLIIILHSYKCFSRDKKNSHCAANNQSYAHVPCNLPLCGETKVVIHHMVQCNTQKCAFPHCESSRQIVAHWKYCTNEACPVCSPLRRLQNESKLTLPDVSNIPTIPHANGDPYRNQHGVPLVMPRMPSVTHQWHTQVPMEVRVYHIEKLIQACCPKGAALTRNPMKHLQIWSMRVEGRHFEETKNRDEYYKKMSGTILEWQKSTEKQAPVAALEQLHIE